MTRTYVPPLVEQLHGPDPTAGSDCAICCARMAIQYATDGKVYPSPDKIRAQAGLDEPDPPPSDYSTTITEYARAVNAFDDEARDRGYDGIGANVQERGPWDAGDSGLAPTIRAESKWITVFVDYGVVNDREPNKTGDKDFRGAHAVSAFGYTPKEDSGNGQPRVKIFDPLCDGRHSNIPKGPVWWNLATLRDAADAYAGGGSGNATWCVTPRSKLLTPPPDPEPPDPCAMSARASDLSALLEEARQHIRELDGPGAQKLAAWIRLVQGVNREGRLIPIHSGVTPDEP